MFFATALSTLFLISAASAQVTVKVGSGADSSTPALQFTPSSITAPKGTVVTFQFTGAPGNHTVTQSTFADPCNPAPNGFDSGYVPVSASPAAGSTPQWSLTITDDTTPIWFYCKQLVGSHCSAGMVGAINAPTTGNTFDAFQTNAKSFTGTAGQAPGGLVGVGASASASAGPVSSAAAGSSSAPATKSSAGTGSSSSAPPAGQTAPGGGSTSSPAPTQTGPTTTGSSKPNSAAGLAANSLFAMFAAALGFVLA